MTINVERLSGYLEAMGHLNDGCDHISLYEAERVNFKNESIKKTLRTHFENQVSGECVENPIRGNWNITIEELDNGRDALKKLAHYYFFELRNSPKPGNVNANSSENVVAGFIDCFEECIEFKTPTFYRVKASTNKGQDVIIFHTILVRVENEFCLIRFGFTD